MAFLPQSNFNAETLLSSYNISTGATSVSSTDCSEYRSFSLQVTYASIVGGGELLLEQSLDGTVWDEIDGVAYDIPNGTGSFTLDKNFWSGAFLRAKLDQLGSAGTATIKLIMKK